MNPKSHEFDPGARRQSWRQKTNEKCSFLNDHCLAFLEAPHFDVRHLEIGQETKKLGSLPRKCQEFESRTWQ